MLRGPIRTSAVALIASTMLWPSVAYATTWYVGAPRVDRHAGCARPKFETIQAAIDRATSGDVIVVCAGAYAEQLVVREKSLHLRGMQGASVTAPADGSGPVILFAGPQRSKLEGLRVSGAGAPGVRVGIRADGFDFDDQPPPGDSRTVLTIVGSHVVDIAGVGIFLEEADGAVIASVLEGYATAGIVIDGNQTGSQVEITGNALRGEGTQRPGQRGIVLDECDATVRANYVVDHGGTDPASDGAGLWVEFARVSALKNAFADNGTGIRLQPGSGSRLERNVIVGAAREGIALLHTRQARIARNRLRAAGGDGVVLSAAEDNTIAGNDIEHCAGAGLHLLADAKSNTLIHNSALGNGALDLLDEAPLQANAYRNNECDESSPAGLCE